MPLYQPVSGNLTTVLGGGNVITQANLAAAAGQKIVTVDDSTGFLAGARCSYVLVGGAVEYNLIDTVDTGTQITLTTNIGTGGIADNAYVAMISESEYQAAYAIKYGNNILPTLATAMGWSAMGVYNVLAYGADNSGVSDSRASINAAITACNAAGGGTVYMPPGTYLTTASASPNVSQTVYVGIVTRSNVTLAGAGPEATIIKLADAQDGATNAGVRIITHYNDLSTGTDSDFHFRDFTVDGNYANQGGLTKLRDTGILCNYATRVSHTRIVVRGVYGTSAGGDPSGEGFGYTAVVSREISYVDCIGYGAGYGTNTATNFGCSSGTNIKYVNCVARDSGIANGFAVNNASNVLYVNCHSYLNYVHGFNLEFARHVIYDNCIGGGIPATQTGGPFAVKTITGITNANPAVVTSTAHGFVDGDYVYIGGNVNTVAQTEIVGMVQVNDAIYKVAGSTADTFQLNTPAGAAINSSAYGTWTAGGVICKIMGNYGQGFRCQSGRDVEYNSCQAIANGYGTSQNHGLGIQGSHHRVLVNGGIYRFNRASGIYYANARPNQLFFAGYPRISANYGGTNIATTIKNMDVVTTLSSTAAAAATSVILTDSTGMANGNTVEIVLDNGDSHITTITGVAPGATDTVTVSALPSIATAGNAVYLLKAPVITWPATAILANPSASVVSGTVYTNEYPFPVMITVTGGTTVVVIRSGTTTGFTNGQFIVPPGGTITITHAGAPTWRWFQA